jgi:hypothetical protein
MTRPLILSDNFVKQSDESQRSFRLGSPRTPPPACPNHAAGRPSDARNAARRLQALWPSKLPLRRWAGPWPEALSFGQSTGHPPAPRLCTQYRRRSRRSVHQQPANTSGRARPDMRHQYRVIAASRRPWIDRLGSFTCPVRLEADRRYSRQYGHVLPRRRSAADFGGDAR